MPLARVLSEDIGINFEDNDENMKLLPTRMHKWQGLVIEMAMPCPNILPLIDLLTYWRIPTGPVELEDARPT